MKLIDLSVLVNEQTPNYPGDPKIKIETTGLLDWLDKNRNKKVYVGASAGSILATPTIAVADVDNIDENMPENLPAITDLRALGWVQFEFIPHVPDWISPKTAEKYAKMTSNELYVVDDRTAIKVDGGNIEVISEGAWKLFNEQAEIS